MASTGSAEQLAPWLQYAIYYLALTIQLCVLSARRFENNNKTKRIASFVNSSTNQTTAELRAAETVGNVHCGQQPYLLTYVHTYVRVQFRPADTHKTFRSVFLSLFTAVPALRACELLLSVQIAFFHPPHHKFTLRGTDGLTALILRCSVTVRRYNGATHVVL